MRMEVLDLRFTSVPRASLGDVGFFPKSVSVEEAQQMPRGVW